MVPREKTVLENFTVKPVVFLYYCFHLSGRDTWEQYSFYPSLTHLCPFALALALALSMLTNS